MTHAAKILLFCFVLATGVQARQPTLDGQQIKELPTTTIEVIGIIIDPAPCVINNDKPVDVEFGEMLIRLIDGSQYSQPIPVDISCPETFKGEISLKLSGNNCAFDINLLATSNPNLGIQILINDTPIMVNTFYEVDWRQQVKLTAIPLINPLEKAQPGEFTASATLLAIVN